MEQGQACMLCRQAEADLATCGRKLENSGICAHEFCLFFANKLFQKGERDGVCLRYIRRAIKRAGKKECFVCGQSGASITCQETGCERSFHLPCAARGRCVTQYFGQYRSFCWEHSPEQAVEVAPEEGTDCLICMNRVEGQRSYSTMVCPACKHAWFHRACIQYQAIHAGVHCFCCPHCKNEYKFHMEMLTMGIRIPRRPLTWENTSAFTASTGRHGRCDASECLCLRGREQAEGEGPWELLLCRSCAAKGTHRRCSSLRPRTASWECDGCAGPSTDSRDTPELDRPATASQSGSGPSHRSNHRQNRSCSRRRDQTPSRQPRRRSGRRQSPRARAESRTHSRAVPEPSHTLPVPETTSRSTDTGHRSSRTRPVRVRDGSRSRRRDQTPTRQPRRSSVRSRSPIARAESSTHSQAVTGPSHTPPVPQSTNSRHRSSCREPAWARDRSRLRRQGQNPSSRPSRCCDRSRSPIARAESSTNSQAMLGPSHTPPVPQSTSPSTNNSRCSSRPKPAWVRDRSRFQ